MQFLDFCIHAQYDNASSLVSVLAYGGARGLMRGFVDLGI